MIAKRAVISSVRNLEWESFSLPDKPNSKEVIVRSLYSLISPGTELAIFTGTHRGFSLEHPPFPLIPSNPGYALLGEVIALGEDVVDIPLGARILAEIPHGTHGVIDIRKNPIIIIPPSIADQTAPLIRMVKIAITALRLAPPQLGDCVGVFGLGLVGLFACQLYRLSGARPVLGFDLFETRRRLAEEAGIRTGIPTSGEREADIIVEATGNPTVIPQALELVRRGGKVVLLGSPRGTFEIDPYLHIHRKGAIIVGAHESLQEDRKRNLETIVSLVASREIRTEGYVTHILEPAQIPWAYSQMEKNPETILGALIDWKGATP